MRDDLEDRRVKYYSDNDLSVSFNIARVEEVLSEEIALDSIDINDAIELLQCNLLLTRCLTEEAKHSERFSPLIARINELKPNVFRTINELVNKDGLLNAYEDTRIEYKETLIDIVSDGNSYRLIPANEVKRL